MSELPIEKILNLEPGKGIKAAGKIPANAEFFKDHFPEFAVLPGVLALEMLKLTAEAYLQETKNAPDKKYYLKQLKATKFHSYLRPGDEWESQLELVSDNENESIWKGKLLHKGKTAASAQLVLATSHSNTRPVAS